MKTNIDPEQNLQAQMRKIVDTRKATNWGSKQWIKLNNQFNALLSEWSTIRQVTLPEHIKKFWKN